MQKGADPIGALRSRRAEIAREIEDLRREDAELEIAQAALMRLSGRQPSDRKASTAYSVERIPDMQEAARVPRSQREAVLGVLGGVPDPWVRSGDIIEIARRRWGFVIPERSLRPLLSVMKREGVVARRGRLVAAADRAASEKRRETRLERAANANTRD